MIAHPRQDECLCIYVCVGALGGAFLHGKMQMLNMAFFVNAETIGKSTTPGFFRLGRDMSIIFDFQFEN